MGLFNKLLKTGLNVVTAPIDVVKDVMTLGGDLIEGGETYTGKKFKKIIKNTEEIQDEIDDL